MSRLTRDGTAEPVSRDQILRHARGQGNVHFPCSADHEQDWQPYPVDPYSAICDDHTYIHTYISATKSQQDYNDMGSGAFPVLPVSNASRSNFVIIVALREGLWLSYEVPYGLVYRLQRGEFL